MLLTFLSLHYTFPVKPTDPSLSQMMLPRKIQACVPIKQLVLANRVKVKALTFLRLYLLSLTVYLLFTA